MILGEDDEAEVEGSGEPTFSRDERPLGKEPPARPLVLGSGRRNWREVMSLTARALRTRRGERSADGPIHIIFSKKSLICH
jgi:hypothetical protein